MWSAQPSPVSTGTPAKKLQRCTALTGCSLHAVKYALRVKGDSKPFQESPEDGLETDLDKGVVCKAFDLALPKMKKGEQASFIIEPACVLPRPSAAWLPLSSCCGRMQR